MSSTLENREGTMELRQYLKYLGFVQKENKWCWENSQLKMGLTISRDPEKQVRYILKVQAMKTIPWLERTLYIDSLDLLMSNIDILLYLQKENVVTSINFLDEETFDIYREITYKEVAAIRYLNKRMTQAFIDEVNEQYGRIIARHCIADILKEGIVKIQTGVLKSKNIKPGMWLVSLEEGPTVISDEEFRRNYTK